MVTQRVVSKTIEKNEDRRVATKLPLLELISEFTNYTTLYRAAKLRPNSSLNGLSH